MSTSWLKKLVAFCVLMESGEGITQKSPDYVMEKWGLVTMCPDDVLPTLMDPHNQAKYNKYLKQWVAR